MPWKGKEGRDEQKHGGAEGRGSLVQSPSQRTASLIYITSSRVGLGGARTAWLPPLPALLLSRAERQASGCGMDRGQDWHVSVFILLSFSFFFFFFRCIKAEINSTWTGMPCGCLTAEANLRYGHTNTEQTMRRSNYREEKSNHLTRQRFIFPPADSEWKAGGQKKRGNVALG